MSVEPGITLSFCDVCGTADAAAARVHQCRLPMPFSFGYCGRCSREGLEPLFLVEEFLADQAELESLLRDATAVSFGDLPGGARTQAEQEAAVAGCRARVARSLAFHGKAEPS